MPPFEELEEHLRHPLGHVSPVLSKLFKLIAVSVQLLSELLALQFRALGAIAQRGERLFGGLSSRAKRTVLMHHLLESRHLARRRGEPCADLGPNVRIHRRGGDRGPNDSAPDEKDHHHQDQEESRPAQQQLREGI